MTTAWLLSSGDVIQFFNWYRAHKSGFLARALWCSEPGSLVPEPWKAGTNGEWVMPK